MHLKSVALHGRFIDGVELFLWRTAAIREAPWIQFSRHFLSRYSGAGTEGDYKKDKGCMMPAMKGSMISWMRIIQGQNTWETSFWKICWNLSFEWRLAWKVFPGEHWIFPIFEEISVLVKPFLSVHYVPDSDTITASMELAMSLIIFKFNFIKINLTIKYLLWYIV